MFYFIQIPSPYRNPRQGVLGYAKIPNISNLRIKEVLVTREYGTAFGISSYDVRIGTPGSAASIYPNDASLPKLATPDLSVIQALDIPVNALDTIEFWLKYEGSTGAGLRPTLTLKLDDSQGITTALDTASYTTASLANGAAENISIQMGRSFILSRIIADKAARIRLYRSIAHRTADSARGLVAPSGEHGLITEVNLVASNLDYVLAPVPFGITAESPRSNMVAGIIENKSGATGTVTVSFDKITLEK